MKHSLLFVIALLATLITLSNIRPRTAQFTPLPPEAYKEVTPVPPVAPPASPPRQEWVPTWKSLPAVRKVDGLGKILSDIDSHLPAGHQYKDNDKITWAHETTHGINSRIRNEFQKGGVGWTGSEWLVTEQDRVNGFYLLDDKAVVIKEPAIRLSAVKNSVPSEFRGGVFNLYLVQQAGQWDDSPLYVFDEWTAYANGSAARLDLGIKDRQETVAYTMEFCVYALAVAMQAKTEDLEFKKYLGWHLERCMNLMAENNSKLGASDAIQYWEKVKTSPHGKEMRAFTRSYLGQEWAERVLGFGPN